jgi:hypothetical protein
MERFVGVAKEDGSTELEPEVVHSMSIAVLAGRVFQQERKVMARTDLK